MTFAAKGMHRISGSAFYHGTVEPLLGAAGALIAFAAIYGEGFPPTSLVLVGVLATLFVFVPAIVRVCHPLADAFIDGSNLLLVVRDRRALVPFGNIRRVYSRHRLSNRIIVEFAEPTSLGQSAKFVPKWEPHLFGPHPVEMRLRKVVAWANQREATPLMSTEDWEAHSQSCSPRLASRVTFRQAMKKRRAFVSLAALIIVTGFLAAPSILPVVLHAYREDITFRVDTREKVLFLTIDDSPSESTDAILDVLDKHGVSATFFIMAGRASSAGTLEHIVSRGHLLGNHLRTSKACSKLTMAEFRTDFDHCASIVEPLQIAKFFRPSSDFGTREQLAYTQECGYEAVMGTVFPLDHWISSPTWMCRLAVWLSVDGGIIILHDGGVRGAVTATVLDGLLPRLKREGYHFARLDQMSSTKR